MSAWACKRPAAPARYSSTTTIRGPTTDGLLASTGVPWKPQPSGSPLLDGPNANTIPASRVFQALQGSSAAGPDGRARRARPGAFNPPVRYTPLLAQGAGACARGGGGADVNEDHGAGGDSAAGTCVPAGPNLSSADWPCRLCSGPPTTWC